MYSNMYQFLRERFGSGGGEIRKHSAELEKSQWLSLDELRQIQLGKLKRLVHYAYEHVPFYRNSLKKKGIVPSDIRSFKDFEAVPFVVRDDFFSSQEDLRSKSFRGRTFKDNTGGSTGQVMEFIVDYSTSYWSYANEKRFRGWYGVRPGDKKAWVWGALKNFPNWTLRDRLIKGYIKRNRFLNAHALSEENMRTFALEMQAWKPDMFRVYPSAMAIWGNFLKASKLDGIRPKLIETSGEKLTPTQRAMLEPIFKSPIAEHYSSWEIYDIAYQCPEKGLHVSEDRYLEVVDPQGKPVQPGEVGEIVITSLIQYAMPFIRYKNGDMGILENSACKCGRGLPLLKEVIGRKDDLLVRPDGQPVHGAVMDYACRSFPEIKQFQLYQPDLYNLIVRLVCYQPASKEWVAKFTGELQPFFGPEMKIQVEILDKIPLTPSGKLRFILSQVKPDNLKIYH
jgi:phenylacetate-CoA ligase